MTQILPIRIGMVLCRPQQLKDDKKTLQTKPSKTDVEYIARAAAAMEGMAAQETAAAAISEAADALAEKEQVGNSKTIFSETIVTET